MSLPLSAHAAYASARDAFAEIGVDTEACLDRLDRIPLSIHCWQGDDVHGFEDPDAALTGGIQASGNYPGRARNAEQLRADLDVAMAQIPGAKRLNLHAIYLESARPVRRDEILPEHFRGWVQWAKQNKLGLDFNPTCFSHKLSEQGFTLSHPDAAVRRFWIDHCKASRRVSASFGEALGSASVMDIWAPDGFKDQPADKYAPRRRLMESLDAIIAEPLPKAFHRDAVEGKLFGIGAESCTIGSNEFYLAYAVSRKILLCLDAGHFHPTESIADKLSAVLPFIDEMLLHVSRPVRWDSDHVVLLDDETQAIANELVRGDVLDRVHIGLDYFDASINRLAAWVIGARNMRKALLRALLEPRKLLRQAESNWDFTTRLVLFEEQKSMPWSAVWDHYCASRDVPVGLQWLDTIKRYETSTFAKRDAL